MGKRRRKFSREFKVEAVRLVTEGGRTLADVARELKVNANLLGRWKLLLNADGEQAFPGKGRLKPLEERVRQLELELKRVQQERDFLKKATAFFARESK